MEENYSRGKRFGDKFWNGKTIDVLSVGFCFCEFRSSRCAKTERAFRCMRLWEISCEDRLGFDPRARILS